MKNKIIGILGMAAMLGGCAGQAQTYYMGQSDGGSQAVTFPNGTMFGGASGRQASSLAQIRQDAMSSKNLQTSQHALQVLENLSQQLGTGEITLFFPTGSGTLPTSGLQYDRLINFVDYLSRMSRGGKSSSS